MKSAQRSVAGKTLDISSTVDLLVVGAGPAGIAAAMESAEHGLSVMPVDENPVSYETMAENVPLNLGGRMQRTVANRNAAIETILATSPALAEAFDLGIDVRSGTACIGFYVNRDNLNWMPGPVAALAETENGTQLVRFSQAIVATGRRDMGLAFPGWELAGVLGSTAAVSLATRYEALDGRRALFLGSSAEAMLDALTLADGGVEVLGLVEQADQPIGPSHLAALLGEQGIAIDCGKTIVQARSTALGGVEEVRFSSGETVDCDLLVLGVGTVPVVDLLDAAGCRLSFQNEKAGFVPDIDQNGTTSLPQIHAVGDCADIWPAKSADTTIGEIEGRRAARAVCAALGIRVPDEDALPLAAAPGRAFDVGEYRKAWVRSTLVAADDPTGREPYVCQCEEVTAREIVEVRPPRYLEWTGEAPRRSSLEELLGEGPPQPDQIKRLTRAGMGPCQGRRCREQVQALLALQADRPLSEISLAS